MQYYHQFWQRLTRMCHHPINTRTSCHPRVLPAPRRPSSMATPVGPPSPEPHSMWGPLSGLWLSGTTVEVPPRRVSWAVCLSVAEQYLCVNRL